MHHTQSLTTNLHIHTPYSFSAFASVEQAVTLAKAEGIAVLGISDFDTIDGYTAFAEHCRAHRVYPAFGMETIALSTQDQQAGRRWNDPGNPGRIYFCGKGMDYPTRLTPRVAELLRSKFEAMQQQMREMIDLLNAHIEAVGLADALGLLDYTTIRNTMTEGTVRERHLAKVLDKQIGAIEPDVAKRKELLQTLYQGKETRVDVNDSVALQEELRGNLLKAGKPAFVPEDTSGYLSLEAARDLIIEMGGIPCYPVLADGTKGEPTELEADPEKLAENLLRLDIHAVEFIPTRNDIDALRRYVQAFRSRGFVMMCGTEHNTPALEPLKPTCRGGVAFDDELQAAFWQGACVVAGYQQSKSLGQSIHPGAWDHESLLRLRTVGEAAIRGYSEG